MRKTPISKDLCCASLEVPVRYIIGEEIRKLKEYENSISNFLGRSASDQGSGIYYDILFPTHTSFLGLITFWLTMSICSETQFA